MKRTIIWTVACTLPLTVLAHIAFKAAGIDPGGWDAGIGAGLGVALGSIIAAKTAPADADEKSELG